MTWRKENINMIYFTADTHFGHENVIRFCSRPFSCAAEMDEALIENWNSRVKGNDTVYVLGDMFFRSVNFEEILKRLKGKKRLIVGNHDGSWMTKADINGFMPVTFDELVENNRNFKRMYRNGIYGVENV